MITNLCVKYVTWDIYSTQIGLYDAIHTGLGFFEQILDFKAETAMVK